MIFVFYTFVTYIIYRLVKLAYKKWSLPLFNPLLICPIFIILLIKVMHIPADNYLNGSRAITHMLGPATVAFAIPIYKHFHLIKKYLGTIIVSITTGSLVAIFTTFIFSLLFKFNSDYIMSLLPRSITTPIAIEVSKEIGGLPTLTTIFVIFTGVIGGILGPFEIKWFNVKSPIAKGLALGMSAHGVGTSKAMEYGDREGTFSTIAMIFAAWITMALGSFIIPSLVHLAEI